jgi:hypothetical protein
MYGKDNLARSLHLKPVFVNGKQNPAATDTGFCSRLWFLVLATHGAPPCEAVFASIDMAIFIHLVPE